MISTSFDSTKNHLHGILDEIKGGKTQLPDFQRGWVWDDDHIKSLLASVGQSFPIGAIMILETGGEGVKFKPRPLEGTPDGMEVEEPETLILDGQQRLTALFQSLMGDSPVKTKDAKGKFVRRWYYFNMNAILNSEADFEDAVISVPEDKLGRGFGRGIEIDLSSPRNEYQQDMFPVNQLLSSSGWRHKYNKYWKHAPNKTMFFDEFESSVVKRFEQYQIPVIKLAKDTPKEAVCLVFEKVNTGGVSLTVFELLTATFAADGFQLRDDWRDRESRLKEFSHTLSQLQSDHFLQAITLLITQKRRRSAIEAGESALPGISCRKRDILRLTVGEYEGWADKVEEGFRLTARFLHDQRIFRAKDIPYQTQLVPLVAILVELGPDSESDSVQQQIARWYWSGVFGELYGAAVETRFARDFPEVVGMVRGESNLPITISDANFEARRLLTLRTRNSAAYKGIYALLMRDGCLDFRTGQSIESQTFFDDQIDIHHIFPERWCNANEVGRDYYNSVINKTAISARTNRIIGGRAPSDYLARLQSSAGVPRERMDEILTLHRIDPELIRTDEFWKFYDVRGNAILDRIQGAMGKRIDREQNMFTADATMDEYDDGPTDWDENSILSEVSD